ncbi:protease 7 (Protease VII) (Omptin) (Outermembrane protein 3B) (Protease A), partial [Escherichia coli B108]
MKLDIKNTYSIIKTIEWRPFMRAKLLGIVLTTPIAISSFASTETLSFTPDNINADISLGTLSGKTKERVYLAEEGGRKVS